LDLQKDHRDLAKKYNVDLSVFRNEALDVIKDYGIKDSIIALPYFSSYYVTSKVHERQEYLGFH
jgi:hypothetical protein